MFNKDLEDLKKNWTKMNNTIKWNEKYSRGIYSRINDAEEQRSELEDRMVEISAMEQNKQKNENKKWGQFKRPLGQKQMH